MDKGRVSIRAGVAFAAEAAKQAHREWCEDLVVVLAAEITRLQVGIVNALESSPIEREELIELLAGGVANDT